MKKLLVFMAMVAIAYVAHSQKLTDTSVTAIPNTQLRRALVEHELRRIDSVSIRYLNLRVQDLTALNNSYLSTIEHYQSRVSAYDLATNNYELRLKNAHDLATEQAKAITALNKALTKQVRKTRFTAIAGIVVAGGLTYLLITK